MMIEISSPGMDSETLQIVITNFLEVMGPIILVSVFISFALYLYRICRKAKIEAMAIIADYPDEIEHAGFLVRRMIYRIKRKRKVKS